MNYSRWRSAVAGVWLACLIQGQGPAAVAATTLAPSPEGGRFLFVVDKSSGMEKLQDATEAAIFDLIGTGINGQMQAGDTFGLWTFNKVTATGRFAMQVWDPRKARQQATVVAAFLSGVDYENSSNLKEVTATLKPVINAVSNATIFIISDGDSSMKGTPFDKTINAEYKRQRRQRASAKRPYVTTLIARDGWIIDQSVTIAGAPISLPPRRVPPPPPVVASSSQPIPAAVTSPIVQVTPPAEVPPTVAVRKPAPKMSIITKPPAVVNPPTTNSGSAPIPGSSVTSVAAVATASKVTETPLTPAPENSGPDSPPPTPPEKSEITSQETILAATAQQASTRILVPERNALATSVSTPPSQTQATMTPSKSPSTVQPTRTDSIPQELGQEPTPSAIDKALAELAPAPLAVAARETSRSSESDSPIGIGRTDVALQGAATPILQGSGPAWMMAFGGLLLGAVCVLAFAAFRNRQSTVRSSLITQSMERR